MVAKSEKIYFWSLEHSEKNFKNQNDQNLNILKICMMHAFEKKTIIF